MNSNNGFSTSKKFKSQTSGHDLWWFGGGEIAWSSLEVAKANIPTAKRSGLTIGILIENEVVEYIWQPSDLTDGGLVLKTAQISSALIPQGNWNAATNTPDITATTTVGKFWIVDAPGTTDLGGINIWNENDWAVKTATSWARVNNTDKVLSVAGKTGIVTLNAADITDFTSVVNALISGKLNKGGYSGTANDLNLSIVDLANLLETYKTVRIAADLLLQDNIDLKAAKNGSATETFKVKEGIEEFDAINLKQLQEVANEIKSIITGVDDSLYIDEYKVLRTNTANFKDTYAYNKLQPILPLSFEPFEIIGVFKNGILIDDLDFNYLNTHDIEILADVKNGDRIDVMYRHFVFALYNDARNNYIDGTNTNVISCIESMDVIFLVDFTGSMGGAINEVKNNILTILNTIETQSNNNFRVSVVLFDEGTSDPNYIETTIYADLPSSRKRNITGTVGNTIYITNLIEFTSDKAAITAQISELNTVNFPIGNGLGSPEPSDVAISEIIENNFAGTFRTEANKSIILFTDAAAGGLDDANSSLDSAELNRLETLLISKGITFSVMFNKIYINTDYKNLAIETQGEYITDFSNVSQITSAIEQICEKN